MIRTLLLSKLDQASLLATCQELYLLSAVFSFCKEVRSRQVTGEQRYSHDLPQGGLELPCHLTFRTSSTKLLAKVQSLLKAFPAIMLTESRATDGPTKKKMKTEVTMKDGEASINAATSETYLCKYGQYLLVSDKEAPCKGESLMTDTSTLHKHC